ncbi:MAG: hypothetical protein ABR549_04720 [Mycobacteriales bacterium]
MTQVALDGLDVLQTGLVTAEVSTAPGRLTGLTRRLAVLRATPHLVTWAGIGTSAVGMVLLVIAWGKTAGLTNVALQIPYLVSAGFTGIALVLVGLTVVNIDAKRADAAERSRQLSELRGLLAELRSTVEDEQ